MSGSKARLVLVCADDENAISSKPTQAELQKAHGAVRDAGIPVSARHMTFDSVGGGGGLTGEFGIHLAQLVLGSAVVGKVLVAWIQARAGRKARLKIGDVEAEAQTPEGVEALLQAAKRYQAEQPPAGDDEDAP